VKDNFGDRMKMYENMCCPRLVPLLPVIVRIDGNCFSKWTQGLGRPYDERLSSLMIETTRYLVNQANATIGYTQSDEISLVLYSDRYERQIYFDGRIAKLNSILAASATMFFNWQLPNHIPEKVNNVNGGPIFDCRVWNVPTEEEAANAILWREQDATRNSITMAAQSVYSHNQLMNKNTSQMQDMLHEKGINWNDYPAFFKRGTYIQRRRETRPFTAEEIDRLPEKHEARKNPDLQIERSSVMAISVPPFGKVKNRPGVVLRGEEPTTDVGS